MWQLQAEYNWIMLIQGDTDLVNNKLNMFQSLFCRVSLYLSNFFK